MYEPFGLCLGTPILNRLVSVWGLPVLNRLFNAFRVSSQLPHACTFLRHCGHTLIYYT